MKEDWFRKLINSLDKEKSEIKKGGGAERIEKEDKKCKLTARERINLLLDDEAQFHEIGI